jgi:hypothetical protein
MWSYSWIDISPDPVLGAVLGMIVCAVVAIAGAAWLVGHYWTFGRWEAADHQADLRDQMEAMRQLGVHPGVRYQLAMRAGFKPETEREKRWVLAMKRSRRQVARAERTGRRIDGLVARVESLLR